MLTGRMDDGDSYLMLMGYQLTIGPLLILPNIIWKNSYRFHYQFFVS